MQAIFVAVILSDSFLGDRVEDQAEIYVDPSRSTLTHASCFRLRRHDNGEPDLHMM